MDFKCKQCRNLLETCDECSQLTTELRKLPRFEIDCTKESGEAPIVTVARANRIKNGVPEISLLFRGDNSRKNPYHFEKIYTEHSEKWVTLGYLVLSPEQAYNIGMMLIKASRMLKAAQLKFEADGGKNE